MSAPVDTLVSPTGTTPKPVRVLHVINMGTRCGGAEHLVAELATAQRAAGHDVLVLSSDLAGSGARFSDTTWPQSRRRTGWCARLAGQLRNPAARATLRGLLRDWRPDVVHLHTPGLLAPFTLTLLADTPTVLTVHGPEAFVRSSERWCLPTRYFRQADRDAAELTWWGRLLELVTTWFIGRVWRRYLRVVDVFLAPSRYVAHLLARDFQPTRLVPHGLARPALDGSRPALDGEAHPVSPSTSKPADAGPSLLFLGRLEHLKGVQVLLEAMPAVLREHPRAVLRICGAGPLEGALRRRIHELSVGDAVELTGWLGGDQATRLLAEADVVVVPSVGPEAFGLSCLQALTAGRAVVAAAVGGLPDLVRHEETGLLVPPADPPALATALTRLLGDDPLRDRLGRTAAKFARSYRFDTHVAAVTDAYAEAIARQRDRAAGRPPRRLGTLLGGPVRNLVGRARDDSLLRNSGMLLLATIELAAGGFLFWQVVAHLFTPTEVGRASALISAATLVANLALLGMNNSLIRYLSGWPDRARTVNTGATVVMAAALFGTVGFVAAVPAIAPRLAVSRHPWEVATLVTLTVAGAVSLFYDNVFVALRHSGYVLSRNTVVVLLRLVLPVLLVGLQGLGIFIAYWLALALALPIYLVALGRAFDLTPRLTLSPDRLRVMWRFSAGNYLATAILMTPSMLMPVLVAQRAGPGAAAYYYIASLVAGVLLFVPQATARSLFAEATHDAARLRELLPRVLRLTIAAEVPLLAVLLAAGRPLLSLFGPVYTEAYPLLVVLAITSALSLVSFVGSTLLLISGRIRLLCQLSASACAVCLLGGYLLAGHGLVWVGGALLGGEALLALAYTWIIVTALRAGGSASNRSSPASATSGGRP